MHYTSGLVSVLTLTHNSSRFIGDALTSLLDQEWQDWEVLVYDDSSDDGTQEILRSYARQDRRIQFLGSGTRRQGTNGISSLRNRCLLHSRGEFVAVLDSDDIRYPQSFSTSISSFRSVPHFDVVSTQYEEIDTEGRVLPPSQCLRNRQALTLNYAGLPRDITQNIRTGGGGDHCPIAPCATILRRAIVDEVQGFTEDWKYNSDSNLYRKIVHLAMGRIALLGGVLSAYRLHENQRSREKHRERWVEPSGLGLDDGD